MIDSLTRNVVGNAVPDDYPALAAALTPGSFTRLIEGRTYRSSAGLVLNGGALVSHGNVLQNPPVGSTIRFDPGVSPCLTMTGGGSTGGSPLLHGVAIAGTGGTGILVKDTYNPVIENVAVHGCANAIRLQATAAAGISAKLRNVETCRTTENDLVIDSWPEVRIDMMRFGCNGDTVRRSGSYILVTGGGPGPNTVVVTNSQFNAGDGGASCFINFAHLGAGQASGLISEFVFAHNHFEAGFVGDAGICSDETATNLQRVLLDGNFFLNSGVGNQFFLLNKATALQNWTITGNRFVGWTGGFNIRPTKAINNMILTNNHFENTPVNVNGVWPSVVLAEPNIFEGLTLSGIFYRGVFGGINIGTMDDQSVGVVTKF